MNDVLIVKNSEYILISQNGKRFIIDKNNKLFGILEGKTDKEIKELYLLNRK